MLDKVILSSENQAIISVAKEIGLEVPFVRPTNLAEDKSPTLPVVKHALEFYSNQGVHYDAVCLLQVTNPFRASGSIDLAIKTFVEKGTDSLVSVLEVPHEFNPHWTFKANDMGQLDIATGEDQIISRRQDLPKAYHRDGAIYITKASVILEQNSLYGSSIAYIESKASRHVNIDTMNDWFKAEKLASKLFNQ